MRCPHCGIHFHHDFAWGPINCNGRTDWSYEITKCPNCREFTIFIYNDDKRKRMVEPAFPARKPISNHVPLSIAQDYKEACNVLAFSPKASAALSRRCLQNILRDFGYTANDLAKQIDAVLGESDARKALPLGLRQAVDAIRNFGNFSAHPINEKTTLQVIEVEPEEAEWCLEILEEMFEHFYERPAIAAAKKAALDAKLAAAGKPPSK